MSLMSGSCMAGQHLGCPAVFGERTWPDPARKGATFTTPGYLCPCKCHTRDL